MHGGEIFYYCLKKKKKKKYNVKTENTRTCFQLLSLLFNMSFHEEKEKEEAFNFQSHNHIHAQYNSLKCEIYH